MLLKIMVEIIALWIIFSCLCGFWLAEEEDRWAAFSMHPFLIIVYLYRSLMRGEWSRCNNDTGLKTEHVKKCLK